MKCDTIKSNDKRVSIDNCCSKDFLPSDYNPDINDVLMGRGKKCFEHVGNERFRSLVASKLDEYSSATAKKDKTNILLSIVSQVRMRSPKGGFIKQDSTTGLWFEVGDFLAREKVSQAFRDALHNCYRSSNEFKKKRKREQSNAKEISGKQMPKKARSQLKPTAQQEERLQFNRNDNLSTGLIVPDPPKSSSNLVDIFDDVSSRFPSSRPGSFGLTSWFEEESNPFEPIPISEAPVKDVELFQPFLMSGDFEKFVERLNDSNDFIAVLQKSNDTNYHPMECKSLSSNQQTTISMPSLNTCVARTA